MQFFAIIANLRVQDVLDILFLTAVSYHLYIWFWGTKAFKALVGLLALGIIFTMARFWGLFLTTWVFQILWQVLVVLLIILFQSEIRQVLERVNPLQIIGLRSFSRNADWAPNFVEATLSLAKRRIGALIIIERTDSVEEWVTGGIPLDGEPSPELLISLFQKESPLHDGAVMIQKGRVTKVACYLPLSSTEGLPKEWGTRHRAALYRQNHDLFRGCRSPSSAGAISSLPGRCRRFYRRCERVCGHPQSAGLDERRLSCVQGAAHRPLARYSRQSWTGCQQPVRRRRPQHFTKQPVALLRLKPLRRLGWSRYMGIQTSNSKR